MSVVMIEDDAGIYSSIQHNNEQATKTAYELCTNQRIAHPVGRILAASQSLTTKAGKPLYNHLFSSVNYKNEKRTICAMGKLLMNRVGHLRKDIGQ